MSRSADQGGVAGTGEDRAGRSADIAAAAVAIAAGLMPERARTGAGSQRVEDLDSNRGVRACDRDNRAAALGALRLVGADGGSRFEQPAERWRSRTRLTVARAGQERRITSPQMQGQKARGSARAHGWPGPGPGRTTELGPSRRVNTTLGRIRWLLPGASLRRRWARQLRVVQWSHSAKSDKLVER